MEEYQFWQQKLVQFFHDPPAKPYASFPGRGGHRQIASELFETFTGLPLRHVNGTPDWAMSGADRPMLYVPKGTPGAFRVSWPSHPYICHPLGADFLLDMRPPGESNEPRAEAEARRELTDELLAGEREVAENLGEAFSAWRDPEQLRRGYFRLWRRFRDDLIARNDQPDRMPLGDVLWEEMPADSRSPDHSIWDHLKVATALAFLSPHRSRDWHDRDEGARQPWLLCCSLGPTQRFIAESRTSRDLWISSYLLADLAWHAIQPIVEQYGPDCIVYPDLRGNPRVDVWLHVYYRDILAADANPNTFAAVLPNTFIALLPYGGQGYLKPLKDMADEAQKAVGGRWRELADTVRMWLGDVVTDRQWEEIWHRQHQHVIYTIWSAIPWLPMGEIHNAENLRGRALPAQGPGFREPLPAEREQAEHDRQTIRKRRARLAPWVPKSVWQRYEWAREVFALSHLDLHQMERGFDYALTHHQLRVRHALRKATASEDLSAHEPGEKCTVCGRRQALTGDDTTSTDGLDHSRQAARQFWSHEELDPDRSGEERLCAVCTLKRFLIQADANRSSRNLGKFNMLWAGPGTAYTEMMDRDGQIRVPFPAAATLATQTYLTEIVTSPQFEPLMAEVVRAAQEAELPRTNFPRALPRLAAARMQMLPGSAGARFLEYESQDMLFPEAIEGKCRVRERRKRTDPQAQTDDSAKLNTLRRAVQRLRDAADRVLGMKPLTRIAVIQLDGDHMGRLLLGDDKVMGASWRDVIHPEAVERIKQNAHLGRAGWGELLESKRLMGPSLHAFISRALANFSHRIVPWVVEREFSGRLIYAGGDDVLCLAPANEAVALAARLQQLFSAPWVVDTAANTPAWEWRHPGWRAPYDQQSARRRFAILTNPSDNPQERPRLRLPVTDAAYLAPHVAEVDIPEELSVQGPIIPVLGSWASLSAGIALAHFKAPMSVLLRQARHLLEDVAKEPFKDRDTESIREVSWTGRRAVALSHYSRGGLKTEFAMPWGDPGQPPEAHKILQCVQGAFESGQLAARLPYKLRELAASAKYALESIAKHIPDKTDRAEAENKLLRGLFNHCLEPPHSDVTQAAYRLWRSGIDLYWHDPNRYADGLLLCHALAQPDPDEGDELE
jgi:CRISPR-associated protein Cmr2